MKKIFYTLLLASCSIGANAQWSTICNSGNGFVVDLATYNGATFSTGFFTRDCGTPANYINRWDGTTWAAVDTGLNDAGHRICILSPLDMFVAKYQQTVDSNWVYKWDGTHFAKFGKSLYLTTAVAGFSKTPNLYDIVVYHGDTIVSGEFDRADGKPISGIARWTGTTWDSLGAGLGGYLTAAPSNVMYPHQMLVYNDTLYVVGNFVTAGGITVNGVAKWDGSQWHAMGAGFDHNVYTIAVYNGTLYAGGGFTMSGATALRHVAKWDGTNWVDPGFGVYSTFSFDEAYVHTMKQIGTRLFVTGGFLHLITPGDTVACGNIVAWDGTNVSTLNGGTPNYQIEGIIPYGTNSILVSGGYNNDSSHVAEYNLDALAVPETVKADFKVYPIPAGDKIFIDGLQADAHIDIYDLPGRNVYSAITAGAGTAYADISKLPQGTYLLRISGKAGMPQTKMIVKQ